MNIDKEREARAESKRRILDAAHYWADRRELGPAPAKRAWQALMDRVDAELGMVAEEARAALEEQKGGQILANAIFETAQKLGIANNDHSSLSGPQCLHLLECMTHMLDEKKSGPNDPLTDFEEGQWWIKELDALVATGNLTDDQVRAVAVVHNMLRAAKSIAPKGDPDYWTYIVNGHHRVFSPIEPPDDAYDEGTLEPLYAAPAPKGEPVARAVVYMRDHRRQFLVNEIGTNAAANLPLGTHDLYAAPANEQNAKDAQRLEWLLWRLPGDALRYCLGELSDTSDGVEFRSAIDAAIAQQRTENK